MGWFAKLLPAALERDDRALFRAVTLLGSALFAVTLLIAYAWTIDWSGTIPRDGTTLAVGRDFLNLCDAWPRRGQRGSAAHRDAVPYRGLHEFARAGSGLRRRDGGAMDVFGHRGERRDPRPTPARTETIFQG
jgi:hypothetical protein